MDDDKKKAVEFEVAGVLVLLGIVAILPATVDYLNTVISPVTGPLGAIWAEAKVIAESAVGILIGISFPLALIFFIGIIYCVEGLKRIRNKEAEIHDLKVEPAFEEAEPADQALAHRWEDITKHLVSTNQNDWKQAIIEADVILDDILTKMGYRGETVGEKLQRVVTGDMKTLNEAWEAHKVRNQVAHEGSGFQLDLHEAKRTINMYKKVFEEFYYV